MTRFSLIHAGVRLLVLSALIAVSCPGWAEEKPSADERLQKLLKRFPDADKNKDGKLTREEVLEFRQKRQRPRGAVAEPTHANVKYGKHERNVLDF